MATVRAFLAHLALASAQRTATLFCDVPTSGDVFPPPPPSPPPLAVPLPTDLAADAEVVRVRIDNGTYQESILNIGDIGLYRSTDQDGECTDQIDTSSIADCFSSTPFQDSQCQFALDDNLFTEATLLPDGFGAIFAAFQLAHSLWQEVGCIKIHSTVRLQFGGSGSTWFIETWNATDWVHIGSGAFNLFPTASSNERRQLSHNSAIDSAIDGAIETGNATNSSAFEHLVASSSSRRELTHNRYIDSCSVNEANNHGGPSQCYGRGYDYQCHGRRVCSSWGFCIGASNCPRDNTPAVVSILVASCSNTCPRWASDGDCDDGGPGTEYCARHPIASRIDTAAGSALHPSSF